MFNAKNITFAAAIAAFAVIGIGSANAAPRDSGFSGRAADVGVINYRIGNQYRRIRRGQRRGRLTWVEARRLRFELSHIRGFRSDYMGDGRLSFRERRHLNRLLNRNSRRIRRLASNGWNSWRARDRSGEFRPRVRRDIDFVGPAERFEGWQRPRARQSNASLRRFNGFQ